MRGFEIKLMCCVLVLCWCGVRTKNVSTYADLRKLVLNKMPWGNGMARMERSKAPKCVSQCDMVQDLCNNGGVCFMTADCTLKCKCQKGFTGYFCGVKVPEFVTTIAIDLKNDTKRQITLTEILTRSAGATTKPIPTTLKSLTTPQTTTLQTTSVSQTSQRTASSKRTHLPDITTTPRSVLKTRKWISKTRRERRLISKRKLPTTTTTTTQKPVTTSEQPATSPTSRKRTSKSLPVT